MKLVKNPLFARYFARCGARNEERGNRELRRELTAGLSGRVMEVGAGTGLNFPHYPVSVAEVVAVGRHGSLWHRPWGHDDGWADWQLLASGVAGPVAACSLEDGHIGVFAADRDQRMLRHSFSWAAATWSPWTVLTGLSVPGPAALTRLAAVGVRGQDLDAWALRADGMITHAWWPREAGDNLWHRWWLLAEGWAPWQKFTDHVAGPVAALQSRGRAYSGLRHRSG